LKTILITGPGSGLGKGAALGLAKAGHTVVAAVEDLAQTEGLDAAKRADKVEFDVIKLNILDQGDIEAARWAYGDRIDILVNNAAIGQTGPIAEIPMDLIRKVI
jgi:NAD(P)-dependent dehydrogenase (short-subunit alcohol dehydrogenase family)